MRESVVLCGLLSVLRFEFLISIKSKTCGFLLILFCVFYKIF